MDWLDREKEEIKLDEGLRLKAYKDTEGVWTNGYGNTKYVIPGSVITQAEAEEDLNDNIAEALIGAKRVCGAFDSLDGPRKGVILNMTFNLGEERLSQFVNTLAYINAHNYEQAAKNMLLSLWAKQVGPRADRLAYRMRTGQYKDR